METNNSHPRTGLRFHRCQLSINTGFALARYNKQGKVFAFLAAALRLREGTKDRVFVVQPSDLLDSHMISPAGQVMVLEGEDQRRRLNVDFRDCPEVTSRFERMTPGGGYGVIYTHRMVLRPEFTYSEYPVAAASWAIPTEGKSKVGRAAQEAFPLAEEMDGTEECPNGHPSAFDVAMGMSTAWYLATQCLTVTGGAPKLPGGGPSVPAELNSAISAELSYRQSRSTRGRASGQPSPAQMTAFLNSLSPDARASLLKLEVPQ